jgi:hypothetical protein
MTHSRCQVTPCSLARAGSFSPALCRPDLPHDPFLSYMRDVNDGSGYYVLFEDENGCWHELRTYRDGRKPFLRHYGGPIHLLSFVLMVPRGAVEVGAQGFRIRWQNDGRVGVVRLVGGGLPLWLDPTGELGRPIPTPGHQQFWADDFEAGTRLTGAADAIIRTLDGCYVILDFKTARFTSHQDELLPMYQTQLNGYAWIAERRGFSPVTGIGLVYCEPVIRLTEEEISSVVKRDGFLMPFKVRGLPLRLEPETIPPLLRQAKDIIGMERPPVGAEGCKDCERVEALVKLLK